LALVFRRFICKNNGVLFESDLIQVGVKCEFRQHLARLSLFYGNKTAVSLKEFLPVINLEQPLSNHILSDISSLLRVQFVLPCNSVKQASNTQYCYHHYFLICIKRPSSYRHLKEHKLYTSPHVMFIIGKPNVLEFKACNFSKPDRWHQLLHSIATAHQSLLSCAICALWNPTLAI